MASLHPVFLRLLNELEPDATSFTVHNHRVGSSSGKAYYTKLGPSSDYEQWRGEAEALRAMHEAAPGLAPQLFAFGATDKDGNDVERDTVGASTYFLSAYSDHVGLSNTSAQALGKRLATEMHRYQCPSSKFGFAVPTYCGATRFSNGWYDTWADCFGAMIGDMLRYLKESGPLDVRPVLLHGDLWSGNTGADRETGQPVIFDAASYYGHNEADLGIARIFGGIPNSFFQTYHEHMPKTAPVQQYELRAELYEIFHYLNHTVLFGGGYAGTAERKIVNLLKLCSE